MKPYNHFILTIFNLPVYGDVPDEQWHLQRFQLFREFCFPSVRGQSRQDFKWLVFFSINTPKQHEKAILDFSTYQNFIPIYIDSLSTFHDSLRNAITKHSRYNAEYIITTRLDNDDAISSFYVEQIQDSFANQTFQFLSFPYGVVWHKQKVYIYIDNYNPFVSLIEHAADYKTIHCITHREIYTLGEVKQLGSKAQPAWMQVVHGNNIRNRVRGRRVPWEVIHRNFAIEQRINDEPWLDFFVDKYILCLLRQFRELLIKCLSRIVSRWMMFS